MRKMSLLALVLLILGAMACIGNASHFGPGYKPLEIEDGKVITEKEMATSNGADFADWGNDEVTVTVNDQQCHLTFDPPLDTISCYFPKYVNRAIYERLAEVLRIRPMPGSWIDDHLIIGANHLCFNLTELAPSTQDQDSHPYAVRNFSLTLNRWGTISQILCLLALTLTHVGVTCLFCILAILMIYDVLNGV